MATLPAGYNGQVFDKTNVDVFIPELWTGEVRHQLDKVFVMRDCVSVQPFAGKLNDTVHVPSIGRLATYPKISGVPVTYQTRTETDWTMKVDKYQETSFAVDDIVAIQADYDLMSHYKQEIAYAQARDLDNFLLALRAAVNNFPAQRIYATDTGLANGVKQGLGKAAILAGKQLQDEAGVPMNNRKLVVAPCHVADLLLIDEFISHDYQPGSPVVDGQILGSIYGYQTKVSTNITQNSLTGYTNGDNAPQEPTPGVAGSPYLPTQDSYTALDTTGGGSGNFTTAMMLHPDWARFAMPRENHMESGRDIDLQMDKVVTTWMYGAKLYRPDHCVLINTAS